MEQMNSLRLNEFKDEPFLGPAGTGMSYFQRGGSVGGSDLVQEGSAAGQAVGEGIRRHRECWSAGRIISCLEDA